MSFANVYTIPGSTAVDFGARNAPYATMSVESLPTRVGIETDTGLLAHWDAAGVYHRNAPRSTGTVGRLAMFKNTTTGELENAANTSVEVAAAVTASHTRAHAYDSTSDHLIGSLTSGYVVRNDGSKLLNSSIYDTGSFVGIGTASPLYKLVVQKIAADNNPAIMIGGGYNGHPRLQVYGLDNDPHAWMGLGADMAGGTYEHSIYFPEATHSGKLTIGTYDGTTYLEKVRITSAGYVGIGTNDPQANLQVNGAAIFNYAQENYNFIVRSPNDAYLIFCNPTLNSVGVGTYNPNAKLAVRATGTSASYVMSLYDNHTSGDDWGGIMFGNVNVAHGMTGIMPSTDTYGIIGTLQSGSSQGGFYLCGATSSNLQAGIKIKGVAAGATSYPCIDLYVSKKNGTGETTLDDDYMALQIQNYGASKLYVLGSGYLWTNGPIRAAGGYVSADNTAGGTGTITVASVTSITVKNGLVTAWS